MNIKRTHRQLETKAWSAKIEKITIIWHGEPWKNLDLAREPRTKKVLKPLPWCNNWITGGSNTIQNNVSNSPLIFSILHIFSWLSLCLLSFQSGAWCQSSIYWVIVFKNHLWSCHQIITKVQFQLIQFSIRHFSSLCPYPLGVCQTLNVAHEKCKMWQASLPMSLVNQFY